jgi:hypothetical protein
MMGVSRYSNPRHPRLLDDCLKVHKDAVPTKVWSPEGTYFTTTCSTHEEIAGSLVADGMPQDEYWPQVVAGYRASVRGYQGMILARMEQEYRATWVKRWIDAHGL